MAKINQRFLKATTPYQTFKSGRFHVECSTYIFINSWIANKMKTIEAISHNECGELAKQARGDYDSWWIHLRRHELRTTRFINGSSYKARLTNFPKQLYYFSLKVKTYDYSVIPNLYPYILKFNLSIYGRLITEDTWLRALKQVVLLATIPIRCSVELFMKCLFSSLLTQSNIFFRVHILLK